MITHEMFFKDYENTVSDFVGLPVFLKYDHDYKLIDLGIDNIEKDLYEVNKNNLEAIIDSVKRVLINFYDNHHNLEFRPVYRQLLIEELAYSFIDKSYPQINRAFSQFIENLKQLSIKTYESECTQMGFVILKDDTIDIQEFFKNRELKYIPLFAPQELVDFIAEKQTLKIIDSKSVCFVINTDYQVIGLAQKIKGKQSIIDIMMNRHRFVEERDIKVLSHNYYVATQIPDGSSLSESLTKLNDLQTEALNTIKRDYKINSDDMNIRAIIDQVRTEELTEEQGSLLLKHLDVYISLLEKEEEIINEQSVIKQQKETSMGYLKDILKEKFQDLRNETVLKKIDFVYFKNKQIIWSSSYEYIISFTNGQWRLRNYFVLRSILTRYIMSQYSLSSISYIIEKIDYSIPRVLDLYSIVKNLSDKNIGSLICIMKRSSQRNPTIYKTMLQKGELSSEKYKAVIQTENDYPINIRSCDSYLFELIGSVDGAIIMDYHLNILSFGEMISSRANNSGKDYRGARTLAALSASYYGLGLKVSEDGDMLVFENEREIARI